MAFFQLVLKAHRLEKLRLSYEDEKLRSIELSKGAKSLTWRQKLRRKKLRCKRKVKYFWSKITSFPEDSWLHKKAVLLRTDGSFENYILKSIFGFLGGIVLTYMFFIFFVFQLNFSLTSATLLCSVFGVILTLGLAFSYEVRCIVFLLLPQFFSKRGRQALIAYAFILTLTGPGKNALRNTSVLTQSLICGQEQLKEAIKIVVDLIKQPFYALKEAITKVIKTVKIIVRKIKETLVAIKRLVVGILKVITAVFQWLGSIVNICNKKLGTPFDRCQRVFEGAVADCRAKLGPIFGAICDLTYIVSALCWVVKPLDLICMLVSYVADTIVDAVEKKIKKFTLHMKTMFYVNVKFSQSFHFETNQSQKIQDISVNIAAEVRSRTNRFLAVFDWVNFLTAFFVFFMLLRVLHYRHKWLTRERFDNRYITNDLRTIDLIRARQNKETILPLNIRERNRYISLSSVTLIRSERVKLARSVVFLSLITIKICIHLMADYSLFWILDTIRYHGRIETQVQQPNSVGVYVSGNGYLAELYRSIVKAFTPHMRDVEINSVPCLPDPIPPDFDGYIRILSLIAFCWMMIIFEPYSLRLRHIVLCQYYPDRAKQRAAWLYNHIMRSRGSFIKYARRQLRRKFGMDQIERVTMKQRLMAVFPILNKLFSQKKNTCLLCGAVQLDDSNPHIKCPTPGCVGLFCTQCFADLQNICTICRSPLEYGDLSDMSEELDSSDDQVQISKARRFKLAEVKMVDKETQTEDEEEEAEEIWTEDEEEEEEEEVEEPEKDIPVMEEIIEKKDIGEQTDDRELEDSDECSSTSDYSYTYQDELPPPEPEVRQRVVPFKDVEAQKIRDDVTIQIFNDPIARSIMWSSDSTPSCFVVRAHRKVRRRLKSKSRTLTVCGESSSSSSVDSEEIKEDEVIHIEVYDGSKELLIRDKRDDLRSGRVKRIIRAVSRIPWLGGRRKALQPRRPSLINRIIEMLNGKRSTSPTRTYRRIRNVKCDVEETPTSSSCSSSDNDEDDRSTNGQLQARETECHVEWEDPEDIISAKNYEECIVPCYTKMDDINLRYPCEEKFVTKDLPRYLEPISKSMSYYEIDETEDSSRSSCKCVCKGEDINALSDARTLSDSRKTDTWNIIGEDQSQVSTPYTSERALLEILNKKKEEETKDQASQTSDKTVETSFIPQEETDEQNVTKKGKEGKKEVIKGNLLYDPLAGLELYGATDKTKKSDKPSREIIIEYEKDEEDDDEEEEEYDEEEEEEYNKEEEEDDYDEEEEDDDDGEEEDGDNGEEVNDKEKISKVYKLMNDKVDVGTDVPDQSKGIQTKQIKREKVRKGCESKKMRKSKDDKSKSVLCGLTEENEWKGRQWKKCIEEYKNRRKGQKKKCYDDSDSKSRRKRDFKEKSMIIDKLFLKRCKKDRTSHRHTCDEALQFPEDKRGDWHTCESFHPKDNRQKQLISGFIPITCPKHVQSYKYYHDSQYERSRLERGPVYQQHSSRICQREPYDNKLYSREDYDDYRKDEEDDQTELFYADKDRYERCSCCPDDHLENVTICMDSKKSSSEEENLFPVSERHKQDVHSCMRRMYKVTVPTEKFRIPMMRKYLPMYQKSQLIEELKEHDRIRLIREREARRCVTSNPIGSTRLPFVVKMKEEQAFSDTVIGCDRGRHTQAARTEKLPYQETQAFKQLTKEFRRRTLSASAKRDENLPEGEPLISASRNADKSKEVQQLFPRNEKCRRDSFVVNITNRIVNAFKSKRRKKCVRKSADVHEVVCRRQPSDVSSSTDDTTDNNEVMR